MHVRHGLWFALGAFGLWGIFPLYFRLLTHVDPAQILAYRASWSAALSVTILILFYRRSFSEWWHSSARRTQLPMLALSALVLGSNWAAYIVAVTTGHVMQGSLGYFICPLVAVALGVLFLRERPRPVQKIAITFATVGVLQFVLRSAEIPWLGLYLAGSFAVYGLLRKKLDMDPLLGSLLESTMIGIPGALYLLFPHPSLDLTTHGILSLGGFVSLLPLVLYVIAARRLPYATLGLLQYVTPTLQFAVAVGVVGEPVTAGHAVMFGLIWTALALFSLDAARATRATESTQPGTSSVQNSTSGESSRAQTFPSRSTKMSSSGTTTNSIASTSPAASAVNTSVSSYNA